MTQVPLTSNELFEAWQLLSDEECLEGFRLLSREDAEKLFLSFDTSDQAYLLDLLSAEERPAYMRLLQPDDAADVIQEVEAEDRPQLLEMLGDRERAEVHKLLAYEEDEAGGLMNPRYAALRPEMTVDDAIRYVRRQTTRHIETIYYAYVLENGDRLIGVVSLRGLVTSSGDRLIRDVMTPDPVSVTEDMDQETVGHLFAQHDLLAIPVIDADGRMKGIVTVDDIVDVVREEATEDIQKFGGTEALDAPYLDVDIPQLLAKRVGWLAALLFLGVFTVLTMNHFAGLLARVTTLALFVPMIIASGGNAGSQAATLVVRAMALGEVHLRDWWRVVRRELAVGLLLGFILGVIGLLIVVAWHHFAVALGGAAGFGPHYGLLATIVACSVVCVAMWGTLAGSLLPFALRWLGFDPASASAPLIATIVDASGMLIYLSIAVALLSDVDMG